MIAHTPGPWVVHPHWRHVVVPASDAGKQIGGSVDPEQEAALYAKQIHVTWHESGGSQHPEFHRSRVQPEEAAANARLIAAAPELLRLVRYFVKVTKANGLDPADANCCSLEEQAEMLIKRIEDGQ